MNLPGWKSLAAFRRARVYTHTRSNELQSNVGGGLDVEPRFFARLPVDGEICLLTCPLIEQFTASEAKAGRDGSVPAAFAPVKFETKYLADGALSSNTPARVAVALGARRLIILPTGYACARETPPAGAIANALHALTLLIATQLLNELEGLDPSVDYFVLPPLCPLEVSPYDFTQTSQLIERAINSTDAWIAGGGLERPRVHAQLSLHEHSH